MELVDNTRGVAAEHVHITFPMNMSSTKAFVIQGKGIRMSSDQVMNDYLNIDYNR